MATAPSCRTPWGGTTSGPTRSRRRCWRSACRSIALPHFCWKSRSVIRRGTVFRRRSRCAIRRDARTRPRGPRAAMRVTPTTSATGRGSACRAARWCARSRASGVIRRSAASRGPRVPVATMATRARAPTTAAATATSAFPADRSSAKRHVSPATATTSAVVSRNRPGPCAEKPPDRATWTRRATARWVTVRPTRFGPRERCAARRPASAIRRRSAAAWMRRARPMQRARRSAGPRLANATPRRAVTVSMTTVHRTFSGRPGRCAGRRQDPATSTRFARGRAPRARETSSRRVRSCAVRRATHASFPITVPARVRPVRRPTSSERGARPCRADSSERSRCQIARRTRFRTASRDCSITRATSCIEAARRGPGAMRVRARPRLCGKRSSRSTAPPGGDGIRSRPHAAARSGVC